MSSDTSGKVTAARLRRDAYLYIRQSTLYQVANNTESTARQYDLRDRQAGVARTLHPDARAATRPQSPMACH